MAPPRRPEAFRAQLSGPTFRQSILDMALQTPLPPTAQPRVGATLLPRPWRASAWLQRTDIATPAVGGAVTKSQQRLRAIRMVGFLFQLPAPTDSSHHGASNAPA